MPSIRRSLCRYAGFLLVAAAVADPAAAQQDPNQPRPAMKFGPVELWPRMAMRNIGVDNNVYNDSENPVRDFTATIAPTLDVVFKPGDRLRVSYLTITEFVWFQKEKSERSSNRGFVARAEANLTYFTPFVSYASSHTRERPNSEIDERALRNPRTYSTGLRTRMGLSTDVGVALRRTSTTYAPGESFRGVDLARELNNNTDAIDLNMSVALTPLTSVGVAVSREEDRFELSPLRNSQSWRITPTATFKPAGLLNGSASVGYMTFDALDPDVADYTGLVARGLVTMSLERYVIETSFGRDVRYSYDKDTPVYVWTSGKGGLRMEMFGGLDVQVSGAREVMNYKRLAAAAPDDDAPPRDVYHLYSIGLGFTFRKIRFGLDGEFSQRRSKSVDRGFENNRVFGTLSWGATPQ